jgi:hypothetical protein
LKKELKDKKFAFDYDGSILNINPVKYEKLTPVVLKMEYNLLKLIYSI